MDKKQPVSTVAAKHSLRASANDQEKTETMLEEIKQKQIILNQHKLILSAVKEAAYDPTLDESVKNTVNRVLVHETFVRNESPKNLFSESVIEKNAAAKMSFSESVPLRERVENILLKKCKEITDKLGVMEKGPTAEFNADDEKLKLLLECALEMKKAENLQCQEQELLSSLVELRQKSLENMQNLANGLGVKNRLLALKSKVEALTFERDMLLKQDKDLPQAVSKLAAYWKCESEKSEAAVKKAEQDRDEYARLEKDDTYKMLLKEYLRVEQQKKYLETALGKL